MQPSENNQNTTPSVINPNSQDNAAPQTTNTPSLVVQATANEKAVLPLVLSLLSLALFLFAPFALLLAVIALITAIIRRKKKQSLTEATIVLSLISIVLSILLMPSFIEGFIQGAQSIK